MATCGKKEEKDAKNVPETAGRKAVFEISPEKTAELRSIVRHMVFGTDAPILEKAGKTIPRK